VRSCAHSRAATSWRRRSAVVAWSLKKTLSSCSLSNTGPSPGSASQAASARRPLAVIEYVVRLRRPVAPSVAWARPRATSFFGSS
jgi:hypothetical protein